MIRVQTKKVEPPVQPKPMRARYDSAVTTHENRRMWWMADGLSMDAAVNPMVRFQLRTRARYEAANNSYLSGMADTVANYCIGTGPTLQAMTSNKALNKEIEKYFGEWADEIGLARILTTMRVARMISGEAFAVLQTNYDLNSPVKLDVRELECDRVTTPALGMLPGYYADEFLDGIDLNPAGRPMVYHILRIHPGGSSLSMAIGYETDPWPARYVLHDFRSMRPEQRRGIPEITPALAAFNDLREYSIAVTRAAQNAANISQTIETQAAANQEDATGNRPQPFDRVQLEHGMAMALPDGYTLKQTKPEQPTTIYEQFINAKLQEAARCANLPLMYVTMNPAGANMSASYVVTQPFAKSILFDRNVIYRPLLERIIGEFVAEARRIPGLLPNDTPPTINHVWRWPKVGEHADPKKVADAHASDLASGIASIPGILGARGEDWEEVQVSQAKALGMDLASFRAMLRQKLYSISGNPSPAALLPEPKPIDPDSPDADQTDEDDE